MRSSHRFAIVFFSLTLMFFCMSAPATAQSVEPNIGVQLTELAFPTYLATDDLLKIVSSGKEVVMFFRSGRIVRKEAASVWTEVDTSIIKGAFWTQDTGNENIVMEVDDNVYFTTTFPTTTVGSCGVYATGGSYRLRAGRVEVVGVTGSTVELTMLDGTTKSGTIECLTTASPMTGNFSLLLWMQVVSGPEVGGYYVRREANKFLVLATSSIRVVGGRPPFGIPVRELPVWSIPTGEVILSRWYGPAIFSAISVGKVVDVYQTTTTGNTIPKTWTATAIDSSTGERFIQDGTKIVAIGATKQEMFTVPAGTSLSTMSRQLALVGTTLGTEIDGIRVWRGSGALESTLRKGQTLPSGKVVRSLHNQATRNATTAIVGCTGLVATFQPGTARLDSLVQVDTCTSIPAVHAVTDLNGVVGPASPGKIMTLYGMELCSVRLPIPNITRPAVVNGRLGVDIPDGCRVLIDGSPVGLYFAWTGPNGESQMNFLVPNGITSGKHNLQVEKRENRAGTDVVVATSKVVGFDVEDVRPTFFKCVFRRKTIMIPN